MSGSEQQSYRLDLDFDGNPEAAAMKFDLQEILPKAPRAVSYRWCAVSPDYLQPTAYRRTATSKNGSCATGGAHFCKRSQ